MAHTYEDKQAICNALCEALQLTNSGEDIVALEYDKAADIVWIKYDKGKTAVNVALDSGIAMIRDVLKRI